MGFEIAKIASNLGAQVILISGPTSQKTDNDAIKVIPVVSANDMYEEVHKYFENSDIAILSAAVADYKPKYVADKKIKKKETTFTLELEKTKDILASLGKIKKNQLLVGFALETNNEIENAIKKLKTKNLDLIVLNSLSDKGAGFGLNTNKVSLIDSKENITHYNLKSKAEVAQDILSNILKLINA
jgi:phosphopantothenoylcysteine decarboxylase/phosphopantothenate--cysteine ligase